MKIVFISFLVLFGLIQSGVAFDSQDGVAFSASVTNDLQGLGSSSVIVFNREVSDNTNSYNKNTGIFAVPTTGMYVFTWAISNTNGKWQVTNLVVDGVVKGESRSDSHDKKDQSTATNTVVMHVRRGQHVYIRTKAGQGDGTVSGSNLSTFSGWLLF